MNCDTTENPLLKFSLTGQGQALADSTAAMKPLLGDLCMQGEVSVWYAPPNSGKTLIALALLTTAVSEKRISAGSAFYIDADDTPAGLAAKAVILDDFGIHCLAPGQQGFKSKHLIPAVEKLAQDGEAEGKFILLDTLKKFADPMSKAECRAFGEVLRQFCLAGGTVLALSHTNKARSSGGKLVYGGTTDLLEDADSVYLLDRLDRPDKASEQQVAFECVKRRGPNAQTVSYQYAVDPSLPYDQRLASVELAETEYGPTGPPTRAMSDQDIAMTIRNAIRFGTTKKMAIVGVAAKATGASRREILRVLDLNCGEDPSLHLWSFSKGHEHNTYHYYLHSPEVPPGEGSQSDGPTVPT